MPGKNYIKISSVLLIISAAIAVIVYLISGLALEHATADTGKRVGWILVVICLLYTIAAVLQLIAGLKGVKGCNVKDAAADLKKWGGIVLIITAIAGIVELVGSLLNHTSVLSSVLSILFAFVLPGLYMYGASLNERA